ncbi:putative nucleic acid binding protein [Flavobacterium phage vB_FspM_immuto_3-5A]|uniref:Putative nucleic acid binding protein n=1 Tax=Flavobacterium phage vB_FspM_immuto_2-6A TaxID=2801477 RepID=A0A7T8ES67_9CAUD|nr:putative nucleic acid binding protein [Flavobacterium phage vB_FspM_immuto_2-6A]QQO91842.1 putative nucleic acid binding protein [Flavobacterium phage vB_FspM_immuto_2-6A]QQO92080.1 putative nucleic acid binding protein [Flavobacterium phage vB_FspM_immuto_3-5A]QQO92318.1 putative nucleic acid binding protein [Flavobacterium phage vB_FspM_immuto_13-6C]
MTTTEFLFFHSSATANINAPSRINVNLESNNDGSATIKGVTVTVTTLVDWSLSTSQTNQLDLENVLLSATSIRFTYNNQLIDLPILNRTRYTNITNNPDDNYYYFEVENTIINNITGLVTSAEIPAPVIDITFLPFIQDEKYQYSNNNPLISNALENRTSTYIQQSDRQSSGVRPTNLPQILDRTATPAQTQDSNYTTTGWSNARYVGSATDAQDFKGIPPAITGRLFTGEVNTSASADLLICSKSISDRILSELLFTGNTELPTFEGFANTNYQVLQDVSATDNTILYEYNTIPPTGSLEIGSILKVKRSLAIEPEFMRVEKIEPEFSRIQVTRGYLSTTPGELEDGDNIIVVKPLRIFKIDTTSANIVNSTNSKVWVKESGEILSTDGYGMVYESSSLCIT